MLQSDGASGHCSSGRRRDSSFDGAARPAGRTHRCTGASSSHCLYQRHGRACETAFVLLVAAACCAAAADSGRQEEMFLRHDKLEGSARSTSPPLAHCRVCCHNLPRQASAKNASLTPAFSHTGLSEPDDQGPHQDADHTTKIHVVELAPGDEVLDPGIARCVYKCVSSHRRAGILVVTLGVYRQGSLPVLQSL